MSNILTFPSLSRQLVKKVYLSNEITRLLTVVSSGELNEWELQNGAFHFWPWRKECCLFQGAIVS